jgi:uncharacterized membrane protein
MLRELLSLVSLLGSGITAGVLVAVAVSVGPALASIPAEQYAPLHELLGKGYHPTMPILVTATLLADVALAVLAPTAAARLILVLAAALVVGVQAVSHLGNVPINRQVAKVGPAGIPAGWEDPRPEWRRWHLTRTAMAVAVLALNAIVAITI